MKINFASFPFINYHSLTKLQTGLTCKNYIQYNFSPLFDNTHFVKVTNYQAAASRMKDKILERYRIHKRVDQRQQRKLIIQRLVPTLQMIAYDDRTPTTSRKGFLVKRNLDFGGVGNIKPRNLFFKETISDTPKSNDESKSPAWDQASLRPIEDLDSFR